VRFLSYFWPAWLVVVLAFGAVAGFTPVIVACAVVSAACAVAMWTVWRV
jgi:hypothetical protein